MNQTEQSPAEVPIVIDDEFWEKLISITNGAAALCYQCGVCTAVCPWGLVKQEALSVRTIMRRAQTGLFAGNESLWLCTTCGQCHPTCPRGVDIGEIFRGLRSIAWERRTVQEGLPSLLWSVYWNNNPWTQPPSHRTQWAKKLNIPAFNPDEHEILLYIGCTSSYDRRAQKIALALVNILQETGVQFGFLGEEEPCCGESVLSIGHKPYFQEIAEHTAQVFQEHGVSNLITISPHCYDVFVNHYPHCDNDFKPMHYTQYLAQLVSDERLKFNHSLDIRVTFQDPCYLGRHNNQYDAPRQVLSAIPGVNLVEMHNNKTHALCCGGGGGRMWLETPVGERFSDLRVEEAVQTGARTLSTACPFCVVCLEDSIKAQGIQDLEVMDIAEMVNYVLRGKETSSIANLD